MADHFVTIEFDGSDTPRTTMECRAVPNATCHARFNCTCPAYGSHGMENGVPWHTNAQESLFEESLTFRHLGYFDEQWCNLREWFENSEECLAGSATVPVTSAWEGDYYTFEIEAPHD